MTLSFVEKGKLDIDGICDEILQTLSCERDAACQAMKDELHTRNEEVIRQLRAKLQLSLSVPGTPVAAHELDLVGPMSPAKSPAGAKLPEVAEEAQKEPEEDNGMDITFDSQRSEKDIDDIKEKGSPRMSQTSSGGSRLLRSSTQEKLRAVQRLQKPVEPMPDNIIGRMVKSHAFEGAVMSMILLSIVAIALEVQVKGLNLGYELGVRSITTRPADTNPEIGQFLEILDMFFGVAFTVEIVLKVVGFKFSFFKQPANLIDGTIVLFWLLDRSDGLGLNLNPMFLRLVRLFKVMRLVKLTRTIEHLESLFLLVESIKSSRAVCFWATVLLGVIQTGVAIFLNQALHGLMTPGDPTMDPVEQVALFEYFGTFTRSMITMIEVTFGNFVPVLRKLQGISEWYALIIIIYKFIVGFAAIRIISGIFMCETLRVANNNDQIIRLQKNRRQRHTRETMTALFLAADEGNDGYVDLDEFLSIWENDTVKNWLSAQDLEITDPVKFFKEMAGEDMKISAEEMINGVAHMRGFARAIDLVHLVKQSEGMKESLERLERQLAEGARPRISGQPQPTLVV